jgi:hypothetical protein
MKPARKKPTAARVRAKKRTVSVWLLAWRYPGEHDNATSCSTRRYALRVAKQIKGYGGIVGPIIRVVVPMAGGRKP